MKPIKTATGLMTSKLLQRANENTLRKLKVTQGLADFSSNDYLGFSRSELLDMLVKKAAHSSPAGILGATGSRLLTGNCNYAEQLEADLAMHHEAEGGLIFNSGYIANSALFSSLPQKGDTIIMDEFIHASVIDGARLSFAKRLKFKHNNLDDLEKKLKRSTGICYVAVESIYSMDGDVTDLFGISDLCETYGANLIVDEAHAFGVLGLGLVSEMELCDKVFARVITFGKALGLHGAIIVGSKLLRDYLINFARPFIYTTAPSIHSLIAVRLAYDYLLLQIDLMAELAEKSILFVQHMPPQDQLRSTQNPSPIQCVFVDSNQQAIDYSKFLFDRGFDVRPILSPTVPKGTERLRICLHIHNTDREIINLCKLFHQLIGKLKP